MKKTTGYFHLVLHLAKMSISDLVNLALGLVYDTDPDYTAHPYTQAQLAVLANKVRTDLGTRITAPNPTLTHQEQLDVDALSRAVLAISSGVTVAANNKAQGNRTLFTIVANRIGFHAAGAKAAHVRIFEAKSVAKGMLEFIGPVETGLGHPTYTFEYGITTAFGVLPTVWQPQISLSSADLYISGLPSGAIIAVRYAVTIVPPHKKTTSPTSGGFATARTVTQTAALNKMTTILPVNAKGKVQLVHGTVYYQFSDAIYQVVS